MANVLITFRIMPESPETDVDGLLDSMDVSEAELHGVEKEPIAFGLVALRASFVVRDEGGAASRLEDALGKIEGVRGVETVSVTLI